MGLDLSSVRCVTKEYEFSYDWKTVALYALGIGARRDELEYLYEGGPGGMRVYPTFAVVPAYPAVIDLLLRSGGDLAMVVHGGQTVTTHRPIPPGGTLTTVGTIAGIYDLKKLAQVVIETRTTLGGEPVFDTSWSILFRGAGGFDGPRPPRVEDEPTVPKGREPDFRVAERTSPEQALLYRLSGDVNPLHADPEFAARVGFTQGPILHGLCTYGFAARAIIQRVCGGDASRLRSFTVQFRKPVWPGETIVTEGFQLDGDKVAVVVCSEERAEAVITGAWAEVNRAT